MINKIKVINNYEIYFVYIAKLVYLCKNYIYGDFSMSQVSK